MVACRAPQKKNMKNVLKILLNKTLPWAHTESELEVLSGLGKLVKYVVHLSKRKN
jgi:hypothetical protein